jgi:polygalacturonase
VKALGSYGGYRDTIPYATNVLFEKCTAWNDEAAAMGVIYENYKPIDGVTFRDCSVGFTSCSWSPNNSALNIRLSYPGKGHWKNITFENIEIFECISNAFTLEWNLEGGSVENVLVKDLTVRNAAAAMRVNVDTSPVIPDQTLKALCKNFIFENLVFMGQKLTEEDKENKLYFSYSKMDGVSPAQVYMDLFTLK